jgi:DNA-directed RNA polymerase alpha subunit
MSELDHIDRQIAETKGLLKELYQKRRKFEIAEAYKAGNTTLRRLGKPYGISVERVRQIIAQTARLKEEKQQAEQVIACAANIEDIPVDALGLPLRARNCLFNANIRTVGELMRVPDHELLWQPNFGLKSLKEVRKAVEALQKRKNRGAN